MILSVEEAIKLTYLGKVFIIVDDYDRENEGDFFVATQKVTPEIVNFLATEGKGLICTSLPLDRLEKLRISKMCQENTSPFKTAFYCSCEAKIGVSTGISAFDRALTMNRLIADHSCNDDFVFPGHVFPIKASANGVLERNGHTEASADLASLAGLKSSGVIVEIMGKSGHMAKMDELEGIATKFETGILTIKSLIEYRRSKGLTETLYKKW